MYIPPDTTIRILRNVPLDPTYDHTIYFPNLTTQVTYFINKSKYTLTNQTYQRVQRGYIRVAINAENLFDCNYIMFQNTAFGNKWFYAFLKSVEYINNEVSQIEFEIDFMQTWFFDYTLDACFVEREHSATDYLFENIVPENLDLGDIYVCNSHDVFDMNSMSVCILINRKTQQGTATSREINHIYTPTHIIAGIPAYDTASIDYMLDQYLEEEVIAIYQYPAILGDASTTTPVLQSKTITPNLTTIDGYAPKNYKLFSSPYNKLIVSNNAGSLAEYHWEDWQTGAIIGTTGVFNIVGVFATTPAVLCFPRNYRGIYLDYDDGLLLGNFPQCAWSGDTFKAWWAQNKASFAASGISSVLSSLTSGIMTGIGTSALTGSFSVGAANAIVSTGNSILNTIDQSLAKIQDIKAMPNQMHGQVQTDSLNAGVSRIQFDFYCMSIKAQQAKIIDDYFTRYGYATKRNKVPNRAVRPYWTYTKTAGCTISGSIPSDDARKICAVYNAGITFWRDTATVGDYTQNNSAPHSPI